MDSRLKYFEMYPSCSMFLHWLAGMIYVFYSASFILVLRELLRPGVLWFIRNLNDPEFNPVLEVLFYFLLRKFLDDSTAISSSFSTFNCFYGRFINYYLNFFLDIVFYNNFIGGLRSFTFNTMVVTYGFTVSI